MATVKGVNVTEYDNTKRGLLAKGKINAEVEVWTDEYVASALPINDIVQIAKLPLGAKVIRTEVRHDAMGASTQCMLGDTEDADRYMGAGATSSAGIRVMNNVAGFNHEIATEAQRTINLTNLGAQATGTYKTIISFVR